MADAVGDAASHDVQSLLSSPDRDFLIRNNGDQGDKVEIVILNVDGLCREFMDLRKD